MNAPEIKAVGSQFYVASQTYYGLATVEEAEAKIAKEKVNDAECIGLGLRNYKEPRSHSIKAFDARRDAEQNLLDGYVMFERQDDGTLKIVKAKWDSR